MHEVVYGAHVLDARFVGVEPALAGVALMEGAAVACGITVLLTGFPSGGKLFAAGAAFEVVVEAHCVSVAMIMR